MRQLVRARGRARLGLLRRWHRQGGEGARAPALRAPRRRPPRQVEPPRSHLGPGCPGPRRQSLARWPGDHHDGATGPPRPGATRASSGAPGPNLKPSCMKPPIRRMVRVRSGLAGPDCSGSGMARRCRWPLQAHALWTPGRQRSWGPVAGSSLDKVPSRQEGRQSPWRLTRSSSGLRNSQRRRFEALVGRQPLQLVCAQQVRRVLQLKDYSHRECDAQCAAERRPYPPAAQPQAAMPALPRVVLNIRWAQLCTTSLCFAHSGILNGVLSSLPCSAFCAACHEDRCMQHGAKLSVAC